MRWLTVRDRIDSEEFSLRATVWRVIDILMEKNAVRQDRDLVLGECSRQQAPRNTGGFNNPWIAVACEFTGSLCHLYPQKKAKT